MKQIPSSLSAHNVTVEGPLRLITLDHPEQLNAFDDRMARAMGKS